MQTAHWGLSGGLLAGSAMYALNTGDILLPACDAAAADMVTGRAGITASIVIRHGLASRPCRPTRPPRRSTVHHARKDGSGRRCQTGGHRHRATGRRHPRSYEAGWIMTLGMFYLGPLEFFFYFFIYFFLPFSLFVSLVCVYIRLPTCVGMCLSTHH